MKTRVITGIVLGAVMIPLFILGGWFLNILLLLLTLGATYELFRMYNQEDPLPLGIGVLYMLLAGGIYMVLGLYYRETLVLQWLFLFVIGLLIVASMLLVFFPRYDDKRAGEMLFTTLYPAIGFAMIFALRENVYAIGFLFLITIATDIFAYVVGINFGKHRLAEQISPKKSIEGSIGGSVAAVVLTVLYVYLVQLDQVASIPLHLGVTIVLVLFLSIIGQIGDLVASKLKRNVGIKDFSNIFPGHGGIMDRFDSVLLVAIVIMFISTLVDLL